MSNNFFTEQEEEFRDIPEEVEGQEAPPVSVRTVRPAATLIPTVQHGQNIQEYIEENPSLDLSDEEEDFSAVLSDARIRLEQGRLYEMIMNHELFDGLDADPKAVKHVQKQIRNFAKEQMEIMLGMRAEKQELLSDISFPFNGLEVEALRALASAATKGASQSAEAETYVPAPPRKDGLNRIGVSSKTHQKPSLNGQKKQSNTLPSNPNVPIKRTKMDATVEQILAEEGVTREELDATFDPNYKPINKPLHELTPDQIIQRNKEVERRLGTQVKSSSALPMPTAEQEEMMHTARANQAASHPQMQSIMQLLNQQVKK